MTTLKEKMEATLAAKQLAAANSQETVAAGITEGIASVGTTQAASTTEEFHASAIELSLSGTSRLVGEASDIPKQDTVTLSEDSTATLHEGGTLPTEFLPPVPSLPPEVLAGILAKQEYAGLAGPVVEGTTAETAIAELQGLRTATVNGELNMPLEAIDRAINDIHSTSDALAYEQQRQLEEEQHQLLVAQADAKALEIAVAGGDVALTPVVVTSATRKAGDYFYIPEEAIISLEGVDLSPYTVIQKTSALLKDTRELLASHNINISRANPFAGSLIADKVRELDVHIYILDSVEDPNVPQEKENG